MKGLEIFVIIQQALVLGRVSTEKQEEEPFSFIIEGKTRIDLVIEER